MRYIILLLLFACSTTSLRDLEDELAVCLQGGYLCSELQEKIERKELRIIQRERYEALTYCPDGYVFICNGSWCSSRLYRNRIPSRAEMIGSGCISRRDLDWLMR